MRRLIVLLLAFGGLAHAPALLAQACTSAATGNWTTAGTWNAPCNVAGGPTAANTVTIQNNHTVTITLAGGARAASSITIAGGANNSGLILQHDLTVTNAVTINAPTSNGITKQISVGTRTLTIGGDVTLNGGTTGGTNATRTTQLTVTSGTVTIGTSGSPNNLNITADASANAHASVAQVTLTPVGGVGTITVNGNVTVTGGGTATHDALLTVAGTSNASTGIIITGNLNVLSPSITGSSSVTMTGAAGGRIEVGGNVDNRDTISIAAGIFTATGTGSTFATGNSSAVAASHVSATTVTTGTLSIAGNTTVTGGVVNPSGATLSATTGTITIGSLATPRDLSITAGSQTNTNATASITSGTLTVTGNTTVTGRVTGTGGTASLVATLPPAGAGVGLDLGGDLDVVTTALGGVATGLVNLTGGGVLNIAGTVNNGGTVTIATGTFNVTGASSAYNNSSSVVAATTTISSGSLNLTGATPTLNNATGDSMSISTTGSIVVGNAATDTGTVTNAGTITLTAGGTFTSNGDFTNSGTFTNTAAGLLNLNGATSIINGTFNRGTGRVTMGGAAPLAATQSLSGTELSLAPAANGLYNLTIDNTTGFGVTLGSTVAVKNVLTLTNGALITGANNVDVTTQTCALPSVTRTNGWVNGNLVKRVTAGSNCTFEVGGDTDYTPIAATGIPSAGNITAKSTDGDHGSIDTSGLDPSLTANRFWSLTSTVAQASFSAVFNFVGTDQDTDTAPTSAAWVGRNFSSGAWATPTTGTRNATNTQLTGLTLAAATQKDFALGEGARAAGSGSFSAVENIALVASPVGNVYTKLAGTPFNLDLVALNAARNALAGSTFKGMVKVELLNASSGGALDANGCNAGWPTIQTLVATPQFLVADANRKQNVSFTEANAWPNVRVRVSSPATGTPTLIGCSIDNFSIRPPSITGVAGGAPTVMNNTGTSGTPRAIAGSGTFTLVATTGLTGYAGASAVPKINNAAVEAHAGAIQNGSVTGTFPAAVSGTSTGTSAFTYSEVGNFRFLGSAAGAGSNTARGVYDDSFTAVDGASDCTADFSNVLTGGKYGCKFGLTSNSAYFGRFYPANFALSAGTITNRRVLACAPASTFSYAGEEFRATFTLTARNGAGVTTQNYDPGAGFAAFNPATIANLSFGAIDQADGTPPLTATALTGSLTLGSSSGTWASGVVNVTADMMIARAAAPNGPFESFNLGIDPADPVDSDLKLNAYNLDTSVPADTSDRGLVGTSKIRFGRLRLSNASGSVNLTLGLPLQAEYWNGTAFTTNTLDGCTSLTAGNLAFSAYAGGIAAGNMNATNISLGGAFVAGIGSLKLTKPFPVPAGPGSATLTINLNAEAKNYLLGNWGVSTYTANPSARAAFGLYGAQPRNIIFFRENY